MDMDMETFAEDIREKIADRECCEVMVQNVVKNNNVQLCGLLIHKGNVNIIPTIYLNPYYEKYQNGMSMDDIIQSILELYREDTVKRNIDMSFFRDFEKVKGKICFRLVNRAANEEMLQKAPHVEFLDLAVTFYVECRNRAFGSGSIQVYNNHMEMWGVTTGDLYKHALENTPRRKPFTVKSMKTVLGEIGKEAGIDKHNMGKLEMLFSMSVLSNTSRVYGAAVILYPGALAEIAESEGCDLILLPCSVNEWILLHFDENTDREELRDMVRSVNQSEVIPEEVLSDNVYVYRRELGKVEIL